MTPVLQALLDRTEGRAQVVGRFGAWYSQCLICGLDSGPWFTRIVAASSGLLHLDSHHADDERIRAAETAAYLRGWTESREETTTERTDS